LNPVETVGSLLSEGARFLADLLGRMVDRMLLGITGIGAVLGCQQAVDPVPMEIVAEPVAAAVDAATPVAKPTPPTALGKFAITFYYVVGEEEVPATKKPVAANDNQVDESDPELAAIARPEMVTLYSHKAGAGCEPISEVSREFAHQLKIQGTGKLRDGRVLQVWAQCPCGSTPCYRVTAAQWGTAGSGRQLHPFRTVAVDPKVIKLGSLLHVPLLEGRTMPGRPPWGGFVHDGCVVADDVGGGIKGHQLDLFVGRKGWVLGMSGQASKNAWAKAAEVFDGSKICERKGRHVARKAGAI
jgi:3D (Asp-Asp-Asp) domain-containing protein